MAKKKILYRNTRDFALPIFRNLWTEHFEPVAIDPRSSYDPKECIVISDYLDADWTQIWQQQGFPIVIDHRHDSYLDETTTQQPGVLTLRAREWYWMHTCIEYLRRGHADSVVANDPDKFFLLLMNRQRWSRDDLWASVQPWLDQSLYSYIDLGFYIVGDHIDQQHHDNNGIDQNYTNPIWYKSTQFSMISETMVTARPYVSEKTFRAMAWQHPFVVHGSRGILEYLQQLGFETWHHVIDESYDLTTDHRERLDKIGAVLTQAYDSYVSGKNVFGDAVTKQKIMHNFHRFYDKNLVESMWKDQIIDPIKHFANC